MNCAYILAQREVDQLDCKQRVPATAAENEVLKRPEVVRLGLAVIAASDIEKQRKQPRKVTTL